MLIDRSALALTSSLLVLLSFGIVACGDSGKAHDAEAIVMAVSGSTSMTGAGGRGAGGANAGGAGRSSGGGASGGGVADSIWTQSSLVFAGGNDPKRLFLTGDGGWIVRFGTPEIADERWSFDQGATWTRFRTPWRGPIFADSTFWFLGIGLDGAPLARWSYPLDCPECAAAGAPGMPGDTLLIRYDRLTNAWRQLDVLPPAATDLLNVARTAAQSPTELWLYGGTRIFRWSGPGTAAEVLLPEGRLAVEDLFVAPDGGAFLVSQEELFSRGSSGAAWEPISLPRNMATTTFVSARKVHVDAAGQMYVIAHDPSEGLQIYRADDAGMWKAISPARNGAPSNATPSDWLLGVARTGTLLAATTYYPPESGAQRVLTLRSSTDHGVTWLDRTDGVPNYVPQDIVFDADGRAYFCARDGGTFIWSSAAPLP